MLKPLVTVLTACNESPEITTKSPKNLVLAMPSLAETEISLGRAINRCRQSNKKRLCRSEIFFVLQLIGPLKPKLQRMIRPTLNDGMNRIPIALSKKLTNFG